MHRRPFVAFLVTVTLAALSPVASAERLDSDTRFGLGLELGAPTGLSGKYFLGGMVAIQGGVGVIESWGDDGLHLHAEVVWHPAVLHESRDVTIPFHVGVGARFLQHDVDDYRGRCWDGRYYYECDQDSHLGVRAPVGVSFVLKKTPMDIFIELALVVDLVHVDDDDRYDHDHAGLNGALGARYYF